MAELIAFIPTLCALSLVVFGLGGYQPTAPIVLWTIAGAIMAGPVAVNLFGFAGWLVLVVAGTLGCTAYAAGRRRPAAASVPALINEPAVTEYLTGLEPEPDPLLAEMRAHGERDHIPIVEHVTGGLLEVLAAATGAKRAVEVGTAIGVSTLHLARGGAHVTSFEVDPERHEAAKEYLRRDGREGGPAPAGRDGGTGRAGVRLVRPRLHRRAEGGLRDAPRRGGAPRQEGRPLLVDNVLMGGGAATGQPTNQWGQESVDLIRAFNDGLKRREDLRATILAVGDGVALAVRQ